MILLISFKSAMSFKLSVSPIACINLQKRNESSHYFQLLFTFMSSAKVVFHNVFYNCSLHMENTKLGQSLTNDSSLSCFLVGIPLGVVLGLEKPHDLLGSFPETFWLRSLTPHKMGSSIFIKPHVSALTLRPCNSAWLRHNEPDCGPLTHTDEQLLT